MTSRHVFTSCAYTVAADVVQVALRALAVPGQHRYCDLLATARILYHHGGAGHMTSPRRRRETVQIDRRLFVSVSADIPVKRRQR